MAMLEYAVKLTHEPAAMSALDIDNLRSVGFSDRDILDIAEVCLLYTSPSPRD